MTNILVSETDQNGRIYNFYNHYFYTFKGSGTTLEE